MRVKSVLRKLLGPRASAVVIVGWELVEDADGGRPKLVVKVRRRARQRGRCGRCGAVAPWFDNGGGERRWRHFDVGFEPVQDPWTLHYLETRMETWQTRARSSRPRSGIPLS